MKSLKKSFLLKGLFYMALGILPIIPLFSVYLSLLLFSVIEHLIKSCETSWKIELYFLTFLLFIIVILEVLNAKNSTIIDYKKLKIRFRLICVALAILLNPIFMISFCGFKFLCHGHGQAAVILFVAGPLAALSYPILGLIYDNVFAVTYKSQKPK